MFRLGLSVAGPFVCRCLTSLAMPRFHSPLIEPGGRFSRTGLSDKNSRFRPREVASSDRSGGPVPALRAGTGRGTVTSPGSSPYACAQPLAKPMATVPIEGTVCPAHGAEAEVVRPPQKFLVQPGYPVLDFRPKPASVGHFADLVPKVRDLLRRRVRPNVGRPVRGE